jgi:molecular chaperone DnaJ
LPSLRARARGDLVVELFIETPAKLTARQKELLREFAGLSTDAQHPKNASFTGKAKTFWDNVKGA